MLLLSLYFTATNTEWASVRTTSHITWKRGEGQTNNTHRSLYNQTKQPIRMESNAQATNLSTVQPARWYPEAPPSPFPTPPTLPRPHNPQPLPTPLQSCTRAGPDPANCSSGVTPTTQAPPKLHLPRRQRWHY